MFRGFVTVFSRSRVRHSTAEPLPLDKRDQTADSTMRVDPDHSKEWLNGTWTREGGIVGITQKKTFPALSRLALSYNVRSQIAAATRKICALGL